MHSNDHLQMQQNASKQCLFPTKHRIVFILQEMYQLSKNNLKFCICFSNDELQLAWRVNSVGVRDEAAHLLLFGRKLMRSDAKSAIVSKNKKSNVSLIVQHVGYKTNTLYNKYPTVQYKVYFCESQEGTKHLTGCIKMLRLRLCEIIL